jgi:predicted HTH transcriptional regulator
VNLLKHSALPLWKQPETRRLEFKEEFPKGDQIARTAVAFANGAGGKIVFGIRNKPRQIVGISNDELFPLEEQVSNHIADLCAPIIVPEFYIQAAEGKNLLVIEIFPGSHKPYYLKPKGKHQGTYIRVGSANRPASQEILEELERQRRKVSFDSLPVYDLAWRDLDLTQFRSAYFKAIRKKLTNTQLANLNLLIREHGQSYPSNAAILLSDSPHRKKLFPFAKIECARFKGTTTSVFYSQSCFGADLQRPWFDRSVGNRHAEDSTSQS